MAVTDPTGLTNLLEGLAKLIQAGSTSALALVALVVVLLAFLALYLFRKDSAQIRLTVFFCLLATGIVFGGAFFLKDYPVTASKQTRTITSTVSPTATPSAAPTAMPTQTTTSTPTPDRFANFGDDFWEILAASRFNFSKITGRQIPGRYHESRGDHLPTNVWDSFAGTRDLGGFTGAEVFHQTSTAAPPESRITMQEDRYEFKLVENVKASIADSLYASVVSHIEDLLKNSDAKRVIKVDGESMRVVSWQFGEGIHLLPPGGYVNPLFILAKREPSPNGNFQVALTLKEQSIRARRHLKKYLWSEGGFLGPSLRLIAIRLKNLRGNLNLTDPNGGW